MATTNHKNEPAAKDHQGCTESGSFVSDTVEKTKRLGTFMEEKAEQATKAVGAGIGSLGAAIHEHEPQQGVLHNTGEGVANKLEGVGKYLESQGLEGAGKDITNLIRQHPVPALLIGVGVGFLLAKMLKGS